MKLPPLQTTAVPGQISLPRLASIRTEMLPDGKTELISCPELKYAYSISRSRNLPNPVKSDAGKTRKILLYIQEHFCEPIFITDVANALNYSPKYFSRLFSKKLGIPFHEYINSLRLNYLYHLIKYSDLPITDICYNTGFGSLSFLKNVQAKIRHFPQSSSKPRKHRQARITAPSFFVYKKPSHWDGFSLFSLYYFLFSAFPPF